MANALPIQPRSRLPQGKRSATPRAPTTFAPRPHPASGSVEWAATGEVALTGPDRRGERRFLPWPYYNREG